MIRLDSLKIKFPKESEFQIKLADCIRKEIRFPEKKPNLENLVENPEKNPLILITHEIPKQDLPFGVKSVVSKHSETEIELSAKVLGSDYFSGINLDTIERVFDTLNLIPQATFNNSVINQASILRCDSTYTLKLEKSIQSIIQTLKVYPNNHKYQLSDYKNESIVYKHKGSSMRERLLLYDKLIELATGSNKSFYDSVIKNIDTTKNHLRVECNISKHSDMRNLFNVQSNAYSGVKLIDALNSKENPTLKVYDKIMSANNSDTQIDLFLESEIEYYKELKLSEFIDLHGIRNILQKFGYDSSKVRNYLLNVIGYNKSNVSKVMKDFDSEISRIKSHHSKESIFQVVQEIREMLRVA